MSISSEDSSCYPYQALDDSPTATSSPARSRRPRENTSSESTTLLLGNDSSSHSSLSGQNIFVPDDDVTVVSGASHVKHEQRRLQRQDRIVASDDSLVGHMLEPLPEQEIINASQDHIPMLLVEDTDEVFKSSNPNVTFKKPSFTSCEWWEDDPALYLHSFKDTVCTASLTSTPISSKLAPVLDFNFGPQCT